MDLQEGFEQLLPHAAYHLYTHSFPMVPLPSGIINLSMWDRFNFRNTVKNNILCSP